LESLKKSIEVLRKVLLHDALKIRELQNNPKMLKKLEQISNIYEYQAALYALDYYVPLCYQKYNWWYTVIYERLVLDGIRELSRIFSYIDERVPRSAIYTGLHRFSATSRDKGFIEDPYYILNKWRKRLTEKDCDRILKVLEWFEMNFYNVRDPEPDYKALLSWHC